MEYDGTEFNPALHPTPPAQDELLKPRQVLSIFGICRHTLQRWELRGLLVPLRINSRLLRYRRSQVERLLQQLSPPTTEAAPAPATDPATMRPLAAEL